MQPPRGHGSHDAHGNASHAYGARAHAPAGGPHHVSWTPAKLQKSTVALLVTCGVLVFAMAIGGIITLAFFISRPPPPLDVRVSCQSSAAGGFSCSVTHLKGEATAYACWDMRVRCQNGSTLSARPCQAVAPRQTSKRSVSRAELKSTTRCDRQVNLSVENVTATPR
jgi:hypothetical protein